MEKSWSEWLQASWIQAESWPKTKGRGFDLWKALAPDWLDRGQDLQSDVGRDAFQEIIAHLKRGFRLPERLVATWRPFEPRSPRTNSPSLISTVWRPGTHGSGSEPLQHSTTPRSCNV
jgi:hypothetical protein